MAGKVADKSNEADPATSERLGRYELIHRIGAGGMAVCFLARQRGPMGFEKLVVVKKIHHHLARQGSFIEMLLKEARLSALLKHPRIVDIYDLGQADRTYFIAMEHIAGQPLTKVITSGLRAKKPLNIYDAARVIGDAADGLDAAHNLKTMTGDAVELIHRDVSPGNIMLLYDGGVKLLDFGISKARGEITTVGPRTLKGKSGYVAPEQIDGAQADRRADIFSLGVCLWEALTLRRLFRAADDATTLTLIKAGNTPPPSKIRDEVPRELDDICLKALHTDPDKRYQTAREVRIEMENFLWAANYYRESNSLANYMSELFADAIAENQRLVKRAVEAGKPIADDDDDDDDDDAEVMVMEVDDPVGFALPAPGIAGRVPTIPAPPILAERPGSPIGKPELPGFDEDAPTDVKSPPSATAAPERPKLRSTPKLPLRDILKASKAKAEPLVTPPAPPTGENPPPNVEQPMPPPRPDSAPIAPPPRLDRAEKRKLGLGIAAALFVIISVILALTVDDGGGEDDDEMKPTAALEKGPGALSTPPGDFPVAAADAAVPEPAKTTRTRTRDPEPDPALEMADAGAEPDPDIDPPGAPPTGARVPPARDRAKAKSLYDKGVAYYVRGEHDNARRMMRSATRADSSFAAAYRGLGLAYQGLGDRRRAIWALRKYIGMAPGAGDAGSIRARISRLGNR